jgi:methyl-accepting chemotaxis protein
VTHLARRAAVAVRRFLPTGSTLPAKAWYRRHRAILVALWLHVPALWIVGYATGHGALHSAAEAALVGLLAVAATIKPYGNGARAAFATLGLVFSSAILVHFSGGLMAPTGRGLVRA